MKTYIDTAKHIALSFLLTLATIFSAHAGEKITYIHNDALGSPVAATNQLGQVIWRETYKPHGQRTTNAAASANNKTWFTGKQEEAALGINYFGARWYHPEVGRFLVIDPAGVAPENMHSFNRYAYANNNPYTHVDPSGGVVETAWDVLNVGLGVTSFVNNISQGNYGSAAVDAVGVAVDGAAAIVPFLPGGAGAAIKAGRGVDDAVDVASKYVSGGRFSKTTKEMAAERAGGRCEYCGVETLPAAKSQRGVTPPKNEGQTDHITARSAGGTNSPDNAAHACRECNRKLSNSSKSSPRQNQ